MNSKEVKKDFKRSLIVSLIFLFAIATPGSPLYVFGIFFRMPGLMVVGQFLPERTCEDPAINELQEHQLSLESKMRTVKYKSQEWSTYYEEQQPVLADLTAAQEKYWECQTAWADTHPSRSFYYLVELVLNYLLYAAIVFIFLEIAELLNTLLNKLPKKDVR